MALNQALTRNHLWEKVRDIPQYLLLGKFWPAFLAFLGRDFALTVKSHIHPSSGLLRRH